MYRVIILFLILTFSMPVYSATRQVVTQTPYYNPYYGNYIPSHRCHHSSVFHDINDVERYAFNKNFTQDSDRIRLERLETLAFGAVQQGDIYTRYDNVRDAILTRPKPNTKTSIIRNISDYFNGQLTGFTPSITSNGYSQSNYYPYTSGFGSTSGVQYDSPFHHGYRVNNYGIGSGSGVKILD